MREKAIAFPWWENEARVAAYRASVLLTALACAAVPMGLILLLWIALLWKPTETLLAEHQSKSFEESVDGAIDAIKRQVEKMKDKFAK